MPVRQNEPSISPMADLNEPESTDITIKVKTQTRSEVFRFSNQAKVAEIKPDIAERFDAGDEQLVLIYAGRTLKDDKTLKEQNVKDGFAVHLVIRAAPIVQQQQPPREARIYNEENPLGSLTSNLLSNPDYLRALIGLDPRLQTYLDQHPEVAHVVNNPNIMREYMQIASNPNMMQEFLRGQDLTMRNIESMPGGFAALQSLYNNLSDLDTSQTSSPTSTPTSTPNSTVPAQQDQLNSTPLPNPWSTEPLRPPSFLPDPATISNILNDPQMPQFLNMLVSDPQFLQSLRGAGADLFNAAGLQELQTGAAPEVLYQDQLTQLGLMGFPNREANLSALVASSGDINGAIDILTRNS